MFAEQQCYGSTIHLFGDFQIVQVADIGFGNLVGQAAQLLHQAFGPADANGALGRGFLRTDAGQYGQMECGFERRIENDAFVGQ